MLESRGEEHVMTAISRLTLSFLATVALATGLLPCLGEQGAQSLVEKIRDANAVAELTDLEALMLPDETIISISVPANGSDDQLRQSASAVAKLVARDDTLKAKPLKVLFIDQSNNVRSLEIPAAEFKADSLGDLSVMSGEKAWTSRSPAHAATQPGSATGSDYQAERKKLVLRIQNLQSKGVGVKPFDDIIAHSDELLSRGDLAQAQSQLSSLSQTLAEQEKVIKERQAAVGASRWTQATRRSAPVATAYAQPAAQPAGNFTQAQMRMISRMRTDGASDSQIRSALGSFNGTSDKYYDEISRTMLQHELGDLAPCEGPFRMERFRIASKIKELRGAGRPVDGLIEGYRKLEELAQASIRDRGQEAMLADSVRYMEQQLGLSALQGVSHRRAQ